MKCCSSSVRDIFHTTVLLEAASLSAVLELGDDIRTESWTGVKTEAAVLRMKHIGLRRSDGSVIKLISFESEAVISQGLAIAMNQSHSRL